MEMLDDYLAKAIEDKAKEFESNFDDFNKTYPIESMQINYNGVIYTYKERNKNISHIDGQIGDLHIAHKSGHFNAIVGDNVFLVIMDNFYSKDRVWDCLVYDLYTSKSVDMNEVDVLAQTRKVITLPNELIERI